MIKKKYLIIFMFCLTLNCSEKDPLLTKDKSAQYTDIQLVDNQAQNAKPARNYVQIEIKQADENQQTAQPQQQQNEQQQRVYIEVITPHQWVKKCFWLGCYSTWTYGTIWLEVPVKCSRDSLIQYLKELYIPSFDNREIEIKLYAILKNYRNGIIDFTNPYERRIKVYIKLI